MDKFVLKDLPVEIDGKKRLAECYFANYDDVQELVGTGKVEGIDKVSNQDVFDQLEYTEAAHTRWTTMLKKGRIAYDLKSLGRFIAANSSVEITSMLLLRSTEKTFEQVIGLCLFHRTWASNICMDYLTTVPWIHSNGLPHEMRNIGPALFRCLSMIATQLNAKRIWCETSSLSAGYYAKTFGMTSVDDLLVVDEEIFRAFANRPIR